MTTGAPLSEGWLALSEVLAAPDNPADTTIHEGLVLADVGYAREDGTWQARVHTIKVRLHPYGIGDLRSPHGYAYCTCDMWSEWNFQDAHAPGLLPYGSLAAWIAAHAEKVGTTAVAERMASIEVLLALTQG